MRRALLALLLCGCGAADLASAHMSLATDSGLSPSAIHAVEVLVLAGGGARCPHVLSLPSPLDDAQLEIVAHALFTLDNEPKHLTIPAARRLAFYADAFDSTGPDRRRVGRGCAETELKNGSSAGVMITLSASAD